MPQKDFRLDGKTVLITGGSSGIGAQAAIDASEHGAHVIITGRNAARLNETFEKLHNKSLDHKMIVHDFNNTESIYQFADALPMLDGVVHSAGISRMVPFKMFNEKVLNEVHFINFITPTLLTQRILYKRKIKDGGSFVFLASIASFMGVKANGVYSSSKAALISVSQNLAIEVAPRKIRANCLAPAMVWTPMNLSDQSPLTPEQLKADEVSYPLGYGQPEDVSNAIVFLLADASRWITGTTIKLDGGLLLL